MTRRTAAAVAATVLLAASTTFAFQTKAPDLTGTWTGTFTSRTVSGQMDEDPAHIVLKQTGLTLTGTGGPTADRQTPIKDGKVIVVKDVTTVTFTVAERDGEVPAIHFDLKLVDGRLNGTAKAELKGQTRTATVESSRFAAQARRATTVRPGP
jgi:hypothetical protein